MRIESERLILRDWLDEDSEALAEGLNNLEVARWLAFVPHPYTVQHARGFINYSKQSKPNTYEFAIELKESHKVIGGTAISNIDKIHGTAGGGIWIHADYQGKGYGSEAFGRRIQYAFETLNLRRLENGYFEGNSRSFKMQERLGYKLEGLRRRKFLCLATHEYEDEYITGLLIEEWNRSSAQ